MTPRAEQVHVLFRGTAEAVKWIRSVALFLDLGAAGLGLIGILAGANYKSVWFPAFVLLLAVLGVVLRQYAGQMRSFAQRCRRISLRALATGEDIDHLTLSDADVEAPHSARFLSSKLPASNMEQYYEPTKPVGEERLRELYAHSAFYTWWLLDIYAKVLVVVSGATLLLSFSVIYHLASDATAALTTRQAVLDALCTVILVVIGVRAGDNAWAAFASAKAAKKIEVALLAKPHLRVLIELIDGYDIERAGGPDPPTLIYCLRRNAIQKKWHARRAALD